MAKDFVLTCLEDHEGTPRQWYVNGVLKCPHCECREWYKVEFKEAPRDPNN